MTEEPKSDPRSRMRSLLGEPDAANAPEQTSSPLTRLPKKPEAGGFMPETATETPLAPTETPPPSKPITSPVSEPPPRRKAKRRQYSFMPAFWTITGVLSLMINAILIALLIGLYQNVRRLEMDKVDNIMQLPPALLGGLYTNFEKMDRAHIRADILVNTNIPVVFDLPVNTQTTVVLSQDVRIDGARVTIVDDGPVRITNALTSIVLPAGTPLPIDLSIIAKVDHLLPVTLNVPVDIALKDTDLHEPFAGLQAVVQPLYCMVAPQALNLDGQAVCAP